MEMVTLVGTACRTRTAASVADPSLHFLGCCLCGEIAVGVDGIRPGHSSSEMKARAADLPRLPCPGFFAVVTVAYKVGPLPWPHARAATLLPYLPRLGPGQTSDPLARLSFVASATVARGAGANPLGSSSHRTAGLDTCLWRVMATTGFDLDQGHMTYSARAVLAGILHR